MLIKSPVKRWVAIGILGLVVSAWLMLLIMPRYLLYLKPICKSKKFQALSAVGIILGLMGYGLVSVVAASEGPAAFRVLDVRSEYGQLVIEVQHFNPDGTHWHYENYTFQGKEEFKKAIYEDAAGHRYIKSTGLRAPQTVMGYGPARGLRDYLPPGEEWAVQNKPMLEAESILGVIRADHIERTVTGWNKGEQRLTTHPMDHDAYGALGATSLAARFAGLKETAYRQDLVNYTGELPEIDPFISESWGTVSTFYPDNTAEDGTVLRSAGNGSWSSYYSGAGTGADYTGSNTEIWINASSSSGSPWDLFQRSIFMFDTSDLPDSDIVSSATMKLMPRVCSNDFSGSVALVPSTPASDGSLVAADYSQLGSTLQAPVVSIGSMTCDSATYFTFTLNATGLGNVSKTGISKFGTRIASDAANSEPSWVSGDLDRVNVCTSEESGLCTGEGRPVLTVTHSTPTAAVTGTIGDGATEQEVRDGGGTIILTLTNAEWVAAGGTFDAQRQNIIDGLDSAQSETNGWNNEVRDELGVSSVVRTSATIVTVTIASSDVGDYRITSDETITATVPASATGGGAITATPTFTITDATEGVALTGTMQAGVTAANVKAGGKTFILTLTNTKWVADGGTFNAQRAGIITGITSNQSDQNGWDNQKTNIPVTDVARTSDTIVTITLSALSGYAVPAAETLTVTAPAAAVVYGETLTAVATATITPSFVASGTWVSPAINISSITSLAYCALGWSATVPANTSVTGEYSTDGGAAYTTAANGSCPFSTESDQSAVTDLRIKLSLAATASTDTPTVESVGFVAGDTSGQTLRYQLNTTPGLTVTDRTGGGYSGAMSFPTVPSNVDTEVGSMEAIRETVSGQLRQGFTQITVPVTGAAVSSNILNLDETGWSGLPGYSVVNTMATAGDGLPAQFIWYIILGLIVIMLGFFALNLTQSILAAAVAMGIGLGVSSAIGGGLIPGWVIFVFLPIAGGLVLLRPRLAI